MRKLALAVAALAAATIIVLDLGDVDATCEVMVNEHFIEDGPNKVEVLGYSTLSNHQPIRP